MIGTLNSLESSVLVKASDISLSSSSRRTISVRFLSYVYFTTSAKVATQKWSS